jgi:uncharacterized protein (TIGR02145 family)
MKKIFLLTTFSFYLFFLNAQIPPQAFNYSAVARNAAGQPIATSTIGIQISILKTSTTGTSVYSENHFVNSDAYGLFNLVVGGGAIQSGSMSAIDWSSDNYYLKVGMDANGGTNFLAMGTTQLLSVPYALHASTADSLIGGAAGFSGNYNDLTNQPISISSISPNGDTLFLSDGQVFTTINDNSSTNEIQQLSVSATGDTLYLQYGGHVIIPGISAANNSGGGGSGLYTAGNGVTDIDGNTYASIIINGQEWMSENLRTKRYANGDTIPNITDETQWSNLTMGAWAHYNNDSQYENPFGKLYNWFAVSDNRNVCPSGWHASTDSELTFLINYLGGLSEAGGKFKTTGTVSDNSGLWANPNVGATNQSGFTMIPGGYRDSLGVFDYFTVNGFLWSKTSQDLNNSFYRIIVHGNTGVGYSGCSNNYGLSVRCIKD